MIGNRLPQREVMEGTDYLPGLASYSDSWLWVFLDIVGLSFVVHLLAIYDLEKNMFNQGGHLRKKVFHKKAPFFSSISDFRPLEI